MNHDQDAPDRRQWPASPSLPLATLYLLTVLSPVALAAFPTPEPLDILTELAAASGLAAGAMLLMQFLSSGRLKTVSRRLGLDVAMGFHRAAATAILLLVAIHVAALGLAGDEWQPGAILARIGRLLAAPSVGTGVLAAALLAVLVLLASHFRGRVMRYEVWRVGHGVSAVAVVALSADHAWRLGTYVRDPAVALALLALLATAAAIIALVYAVRPVSTRIARFSVQRVRRLSHDIVELVLKAGSPGSFRFRAGQFVWVTFGYRHTVTDNPFSIASAPEELPVLRLLVREVGDTTRSLIKLQAGTPVGIDGPHGNFTVEDRAANSVVLVAGGIGIAPVLGILRSLHCKADPRPIRLLVTGRSAPDLVVQDEIAEMQRKLDLRVIALVESPPVPAGLEQGRPSEAHVARLLDGLDLTGTASFVCGPPAMMDAASAALLGQGVRADQIIMERFDYGAARDPVSRAVARRFRLLLGAVGVGVAVFAARTAVMGA